ncbi:MAG: PPC domain-containing protein [Planctomycetota bacterium]|nr:PPC domain-containing protein [Planctomycetota bacterium]
MRPDPLLVLAFCASVSIPAADAKGQDWPRAVDARWPGHSIQKASEASFDAWIAGLSTDAKLAARSAFLAAQYRAHGHTQPGPDFLVPGGRGVSIVDPGHDLGIGEGAEPNGNPNAVGGGTPTLLGCGDQGEGQVFPFGDRDWWQFDIQADRTLTAWTGPGAAGAIDDTVLVLLDAQGAIVAANDDDPLRAPFSALTTTISAGRYYLSVQGFADVRTGSYSLDVTCGAPGGGTNLPVNESAEPNSSSSTATALPCGRQGQGNLQVASDSDWWAFSLSASTAIDAETGAFSGSPCRDTYLYLLDSTGRQIAADDDGGSGLYSRIQIQLAPGTYYLNVESYQNRYAGGYTLDLRCGGGGGGGGSAASFQALPGGCPGSAGLPVLSARPGELPLLGSTFALDTAPVPAGGMVFGLLGASASVTSGGVALPLNLAVLGAPGCFLDVDPAQTFSVTARGDVATFYLPIPNDPTLLGGRLHAQTLVVDGAANQVGLITSNRGTLVLGDSL